METLVAVRKDKYDDINYSLTRTTDRDKVLVSPAAVIALYREVLAAVDDDQYLFADIDGDLLTADGRTIEADHRDIEVITAILTSGPITLCELRLKVWGNPNIADSTVKVAITRARAVLMHYDLDIEHGKRGYSICLLEKIS